MLAIKELQGILVNLEISASLSKLQNTIHITIWVKVATYCIEFYHMTDINT